MTSKPETLLATKLIDEINPNALDEVFEDAPDAVGLSQDRAIKTHNSRTNGWTVRQLARRFDGSTVVDEVDAFVFQLKLITVDCDWFYHVFI